MKTLNVILFISIWFNGVFQTVNKTDPNHKDSYNLKGKVKSVKSRKFDIKGDKEIIYEEETLLFNKKGFKIDESVYNSDGTLDYSIKYKYDLNSNLIEKNRQAPDRSNEIEKYLYDKNNNLIEEEKYKNKVLSHKIMYEYDNQNNRIKKTNNNSKNEERSYESYIYDDNNNKIEEHHYHAGKLQIKLIFKYDDNNDKVEQSRYNSKNDLEFKTYYSYDNQHNLIILKSFYGILNNNQFASKKTFAYSNNGNTVEIIEYNKDNIGTKRIDYKYNENNDINFVNYFNIIGQLTKSIESDYVYDEKNNWIKLTDYTNRNKFFVRVREIEYFE